MRPRLTLLALWAGASASPPPSSAAAESRAGPRSGRAFDRFVTVWLENADFAPVAANADFAALCSQGVLLTRYFAHTHPSQPNYLAAVAGDYFGLDHDEPVRVPVNVSTVVDLFDGAAISWAAYMEDIPSPGFMAAGSDGAKGDGAWYYVRKHNPFVSFDSINLNGSRLLNVQSLADFRAALAAGIVPQYVFVTPNMLNDGHNTTVGGAASWARGFVASLLGLERTLILLTYDETDDRARPNRVASLLLGSAVPEAVRGTQDDGVYSHYSILATVEYNWRLPNLGRFDVGANVFRLALDGPDADMPIKEPANVGSVNNSNSYAGPLSGDPARRAPWPIPNLSLRGAGGEPVLGKVANVWKLQMGFLTPYDGSGELFDGNHEPVMRPQPVGARGE